MFKWISNKLWWRRYRKYLKTTAWENKRCQVMVRDLCLCQDCGSNRHLEVHHLTYVRVGHELLDDLITLCKNCHNKAHNK